MASIDTFRNQALSFPDTAEMPHFEKTSFRVGTKIFATLSETTLTGNFKLSAFEQSSFCKLGNGAIKPIPNKWGLQGWTTVELTLINDALLFELLEAAFFQVAPKKTTDLYKNR
jgi:predicted DNA-binding protein (MmcQ/YjbR family)